MSDHLNTGTLDPRVRRYVLPTRIVWKSAGGEILGAENLLRDGGPGCTLKHTDAAPGLVLDFGKELHGGVILTNGIVPVQAPTKVRVRFGESVAEVMGEPNMDHAIHDQQVLIPWYGSTEIGNTGFRFVRIDLVDPGAQLELKRCQAIFLYHDLEYKGSFRCSDDRLNKIWETGAYTVHLCMQEMLWDGIKRDRLVWLGDMHPETSVISSVFGEVPLVPKSLDYVRDTTPLPSWMNGISSYSLWWLLIHHDWYQAHGNLDYLREQKDYAAALLRQLLTQIGDDGREKLGEGRFLDWPSSEDASAIHAGLHALLYMALERGAVLAELLGDAALRDECRAGAGRMSKYAPPPTPSKQANALLALSGLRRVGETNTEVLAREPLRGVSTFYGYYVLQARAKAGDHAGALEVIRKYWGAMLDLGATTFWEDFDLDWMKDGAPIDELVPAGRKSIHADYGNYCYKGLRHSLCHGWAAGPTAWLQQHILGVEPMRPGFEKVSIQPNLVDLDWVEGCVPTPKGIIRVRAEKGGKVEISLPDGVELVHERRDP